MASKPGAQKTDWVRPERQGLYDSVHKPLNALVVIAALATIPVALMLTAGDESVVARGLDWTVWAVFLVEYVVMGYCARDRLRYARREWFNLSVVVLSFPGLPDLLAWVRLSRLTRAARLLRLASAAFRGVRAIQNSLAGRSLMLVGSTVALVSIAGGALLAVLEPDTVPRGFWDGLWWAIVTVSTVGYGDIAPSTPAGRMLAVVLMLCGLGLISTLAASISSWIIGTEEAASNQEFKDRLDRIEEKIDRLEAALKKTPEDR